MPFLKPRALLGLFWVFSAPRAFVVLWISGPFSHFLWAAGLFPASSEPFSRLLNLFPAFSGPRPSSGPLPRALWEFCGFVGLAWGFWGFFPAFAGPPFLGLGSLWTSAFCRGGGPLLDLLWVCGCCQPSLGRGLCCAFSKDSGLFWAFCGLLGLFPAFSGPRGFLLTFLYLDF